MHNESSNTTVVSDAAADELFELNAINPEKVKNETLRAALERIKERCLPDAHTSYYTKHSSHSRYSKGW